MAIVLIRTIIVFLSLVLCMRLLGKRQLGELELSELVVAVLISNIASHPLQDIGLPLLYGLLPVAVLLSGELLISWLALKSDALRRLLFGRPSILIDRGRICQEEMRKNRFSLDELCEALRKKGVTDPAAVDKAVLETDGTLNVLTRREASPVTPAQLGLAAEERGLPVVLISDGRVETEGLKLLGRDEAWLRAELGALGLSSPGQVYFMTVDALDGIYLQRKEKNA
jgi:uncharacterized membrane protein YcaP (DUF421 family)